MTQPLSYNQKDMQAALETRVQMQDADFNAYEDKAQRYIDISSIVLTVLIGFGVVRSETVPLSTSDKAMLLFILLSFAWVCYHAARAIQLNYEWCEGLPLDDDEQIKQIKHMVISGSETEYWEMMYNLYWDCVSKNSDSLERIANLVQRARYGVYLELFALSLIVLQLILF
jgi:hypothetical protein